MKKITYVVFVGLLFHFGMVVSAQENEEKTSLSEEQKRFDLDGNGTLNADENQLMQQVQNIETVSGSKLSSEEIKRLTANNPDGPPPGFVGAPPPQTGRGGGRRGPSPAVKIVAKFDTDKDGKLTGDERKTALESRGEAYSTEQRAGTPIGDIQTDLKSSEAATPTDSPGLYDAGHFAHYIYVFTMKIGMLS